MPLNLPPKSLDALKALFEHAKTDAKDLRLGRRSLDILEAMIATPQDVTLQTISEISKNHDVSPSTLSRLSRKLGFSGFKDFQNIFREEIAEASQFYSSKAVGLLNRHLQANSNAEDQAISDLPQRELGNMVDTIREINSKEIETTAKALIQARKVHIVGLRGCYSAAHFFGYYLSFLRDDVITLGGAGSTIAEDLCAVSKDDVFITIAFHPETKKTVDSCRIASKVGAKIITISNRETSPIRAFGHHNFTAHSQGPFYFNPMASLFVIIETLIAETARIKGKDTIELLKKREKVFEELGIEFT